MPAGNAIDLTSLWTDPAWRWHIVFWVVASTAFSVMSYLSVRLLSRLPDFEHKDEMLWGARWWELIFLGIVVLSGAIWYAGMRLTGHFSMLTVYIPWATLLIAMYYGMGSWSMRGPGAILAYWELSRGKQRVELEDLLEEWEDRVVLQQRFKYLVLVFLGVPVAIVLLAHLISALR